jgi:methionine synthase II (cobalamin-independent)
MAEAEAISIDAAMIDATDHEALGLALEGGTGLLLGVVPTTGPLASVKRVKETVGRLRDRVGMTDVTLTPACGLVGLTWDQARAITARTREAAGD